MLTDPLDQHLAAVLKAARPAPPPGWRSQALAAMADVRPRRHPNLVTIIVVALILLVLAAVGYAAARFFVRGTLRFFDYTVRDNAGVTWDIGNDRSFQGELERQRSLGERSFYVLSPDGSEVVFMEHGPPPWLKMDLCRARPDGSGKVNLTRAAGVGGVNCMSGWSPDGLMIAFQHAEPVEGQTPCDAGFRSWVMNRDGTQAHQIMPQGFPPGEGVVWSPDGSHLLVLSEQGALLTDLQGKEARPIPNVGGYGAAFSPDGSHIVSVFRLAAVKAGRSGQINRLVLTKADGSDPRVLVEQFIAEADIARRYPTPEQLRSPLSGSASLKVTEEVSSNLGPLQPVWSPDGRAIAFLAAMPYDPDGIYYRNQVEVWVYDLTTDKPTRMTHDQVSHTGLSWRK